MGFHVSLGECSLAAVDLRYILGSDPDSYFLKPDSGAQG